MSPPRIALLMTRPGPLQDGLRALLIATTLIDTLVLAEDAASTLEAVKNWRPALVILEAYLLQDDLLPLLKNIHRNSPDTRCMVIVETVARKQAIQDADAEIVLQGLPAAELALILENLLR